MINRKKGGNMDNMESLYNEFEQYFKDNQEKINYFLEVLKNVKEDRWEYQYFCIKKDDEIKETSILTYDNIKITSIVDKFYDYISYGTSTFYTIEIKIDNVVIYKIERADVLSELGEEIIAMLERADERAKG